MKSCWLTMWVRPRSTVREIVEENPSYGIYILAMCMALENFFFYANMWSLGMNLEFYTILWLGLLISPVAGLLWLWALSHIFYFTGRGFQGSATLEQLRVAIAWSKIPAIGILFSWLGLLLLAPNEAFIQYGGGNPYALIFHSLNSLFALWSIILMIRSIQEVERFSFARAAVNALVAWSLFSLPIIVFVSLALFFLRF